jgi:hypothetical protein
MNNHTTARIGKRVHVILYNGESFTDKLVESRSRFFIFAKRGRVLKQDIRSFAIGRKRDAARVRA